MVDRGHGIAAADLPHVFEPFYRGREAQERQIHGFGLGLALVRRTVEDHGGRVSVASTPGCGGHLHASPAGRAPVAGAHARTESMAYRILLCEDEAGPAPGRRRPPARGGPRGGDGRDGDEGLRRATQESFDLLILDVMMPGLSGFDVVREVRQRGLPTPILMLTARGEVVDRVVGLKLGADDYLTKPFAMAELVARVEARLRGAVPRATHAASRIASATCRSTSAARR